MAMDISRLSLKPIQASHPSAPPGSLKLNDVQLDMRDGARVIGNDTATTPLVVTAGPGGAHFMMIEMVKA